MAVPGSGTKPLIHSTISSFPECVPSNTATTAFPVAHPNCVNAIPLAWLAPYTNIVPFLVLPCVKARNAAAPSAAGCNSARNSNGTAAAAFPNTPYRPCTTCPVGLTITLSNVDTSFLITSIQCADVTGLLGNTVGSPFPPNGNSAAARSSAASSR